LLEGQGRVTYLLDVCGRGYIYMPSGLNLVFI
jgi:hypothetical protein